MSVPWRTPPTHILGVTAIILVLSAFVWADKCKIDPATVFFYSLFFLAISALALFAAYLEWVTTGKKDDLSQVLLRVLLYVAEYAVKHEVMKRRRYRRI